MSNPAHHPHDHLFRSTFSQPEVMREYVQHFLPRELSTQIDLDSLTRESTSFVDEQLQEYVSDMVYRCRFGDSGLRLTLLLEHKSYVPAFPRLQLLQYLVNAYKSQIQEEDFSGTLTPVIPIVVYHGYERWEMRPFSADFGEISTLLAPFLPDFQYLLTDLSHHPEKDLMAMESRLVKHIFLALKMSRERHQVKTLKAVLEALLDLKRAGTSFNIFNQIIVYLFYTVKPKEDLMKAVKQVDQARRGEETSLYEDIVSIGDLKRQFKVFKRGLTKGMDLDSLADLTEISAEQAFSWKKIIETNPDVAFSDLYEDLTDG